MPFLINMTHLQEASSLIAISESLFQKKLSQIEQQLVKTTIVKERELLQRKAITLYEDYQKSLGEIENFITSMRHESYDRTQTI